MMFPVHFLLLGPTSSMPMKEQSIKLVTHGRLLLNCKRYAPYVEMSFSSVYRYDDLLGFLSDPGYCVLSVFISLYF